MLLGTRMSGHLDNVTINHPRQCQISFGTAYEASLPICFNDLTGENASSFAVALPWARIAVCGVFKIWQTGWEYRKKGCGKSRRGQLKNYRRWPRSSTSNRFASRSTKLKKELPCLIYSQIKIQNSKEISTATLELNRVGFSVASYTHLMHYICQSI